MGKIVKYCAACDESFAEKFGFCPNCGQEMTAFEMNPLDASAKAIDEAAASVGNSPTAQTGTDDILEIPAAAAPVLAAPAPFVETPANAEPETVEANETSVSANGNHAPIVVDEAAAKDVPFEKPPVENFTAPAPETFAAGAVAGATVGNFHAANKTQVYTYPLADMAANDGFHVTVIEDKGVKQRNLLLLGSLLLMTGLALGALTYNLFTYNINIGAIEDDSLFAFVPEIDAKPLDMEKPDPTDPGKGGGGGGGGRNDKSPISKGELPPQFKDKPLLTPSKEDISLSKPELAVQRATQGPNDIIPKNRSAVNGDPNSTNTTPSNGFSRDNLGMGQNGSAGIGNNGQNGVGSDGVGGIGNSPGGKYGNNQGDGGNAPTPKAPPPPPTVAVGVTEPLKITFKPTPKYTDAARQNNVQGTVTVKVTFMANGQIGSIAPVSGLPYGLTEQAIAAARQMRFEPPKKNGVAYSVSKSIAYTFTIY